MRLAILSDVHGNMPALEAVLADLRQHDVDGMVVAGDLTCGPHQIETTSLLQKQLLIGIRPQEANSLRQRRRTGKQTNTEKTA